MSIHLPTIPALDRQTDGQTDRIGKTISRSASTAQHADARVKGCRVFDTNAGDAELISVLGGQLPWHKPGDALLFTLLFYVVYRAIVVRGH